VTAKRLAAHGRPTSADGSPPADGASAQPTSRLPYLRPMQRYAGECLGTLLLVLFHAGAAASLRLFAASSHLPKTAPDVVFLALADGFSLFIIIMIVGKISGVLVNPAVTLALASAGRFPREEIAPYLAAQLIGAVAGAMGVLLIFGGASASVGHVGAVALSPSASMLQGAAVEGFGAFFLVLTIMATAEDPRAPSGWAAISIGLALAAIVLLIEPITGGAVNPARAFGPDLVAALSGVRVSWADYLAVYLVGPVIGAVAAANLYRVLSDEPDRAPAPEPGGARR
jgi:glycerol uptake facilitator protein